MKKMMVMLFLCLTFGVGGAHEHNRENSEMTTFRQNTIKIGQALESYYSTKSGYPDRLDSLVPKYMNKVPLGPNGKVLDWDYRPADDQQSFQFGIKGQRAGGEDLLPELPRFSPDRPLSTAESF